MDYKTEKNEILLEQNQYNMRYLKKNQKFEEKYI